MCQLCKNKKRLGEICLDCHRQKIREEMKEVFDDIERKVGIVIIKKLKSSAQYQKLKQHHLSKYDNLNQD